jgi:hypothetical protein
MSRVNAYRLHTFKFYEDILNFFTSRTDYRTFTNNKLKGAKTTRYFRAVDCAPVLLFNTRKIPDLFYFLILCTVSVI